MGFISKTIDFYSLQKSWAKYWGISIKWGSEAVIVMTLFVVHNKTSFVNVFLESSTLKQSIVLNLISIENT